MVITCIWIFFQHTEVLRECTGVQWWRNLFLEKRELKVPECTQGHKSSLKSTGLIKHDYNSKLYLCYYWKCWWPREKVNTSGPIQPSVIWRNNARGHDGHQGCVNTFTYLMGGAGTWTYQHSNKPKETKEIHRSSFHEYEGQYNL